MMSNSAVERRWSDAIGVLPLETVLAQEHDGIHGDSIAATLDGVDVAFKPVQIIDPAALAHRMLRARTVLDETGTRAEEPALDAAAIFVLEQLSDSRRAEILAALSGCAEARTRSDERLHLSDASSVEVGQLDPHASPVERADAVLVRQLVPDLNALLDRALHREPAFIQFIDAGAIAALGAETPQTARMANRLLLEAAFAGQVGRIQDVRLDIVYDAVRRRDTSALCLSGGGIRSATFANGVLRGLAKHGLLGRFDYLSTVSGGGYAGSWLSAWMHHSGAPEVHQQLAAAGQQKLAPEPPPMKHLREYSHFLAPRVGFLSTDTWTLMTTIGRNMLFNWAVLLPLMAAALLVPRWVLAVVRVGYGDLPLPVQARAGAVLTLLFVTGFALLTYALRYLHRNRPDPLASDASGRRRALAGTQRDFVYRCFVPLVLASVILTLEFYLWWQWSGDNTALFDLTRRDTTLPAEPTIAMDPLTQKTSIIRTIGMYGGLALFLALLGAVSHVAGWLLAGRARRHPWEVVFVVVSGGIAGLGAMAIAIWLIARPETLQRDQLFTTLAAPAVLAMLLAGSQIFTALTSRRADDAEREWMARFNAWLLIAIVMWVGACVLVLYGPDAVEAGWSRLTLFAVGGGSGILGLLLARSGTGAGASAPPGIMVFARRAGMALAAPVFVSAIVIGLAAVNEFLIERSCVVPSISSLLKCRAKVPDTEGLAHSQPFIVRAKHIMSDVEEMAHGFGATPASGRLTAVFATGDARARALVARDNRTPEAWDGLVSGVRDAATQALIETTLADFVLRTRINKFTAKVLDVDSAIVGSAGGDPAVRDSLLGHRILATRLADSALRERRLRRDAHATSMDEHLTRLEVAQAGIPQGGDSARARTIEFLRELVDKRLEMSIQIFRAVRKDSIVRAESQAGIAKLLTSTRVTPHDGAVPGTIFILGLVLLLIGLGLGTLIDTNKFSLRAMYEMRLVRAYLGASRPPAERRPNPFTGFDAHDDIPMGQLWPNWGATPAGAGRAHSSPPFHVVNTTLNLVSGGNLAWQQRKAESMTLSPLHAGNAFIGYRPTSAAIAAPLTAHGRTRLYGGDKGITLGTAVTISGAAASPNAGAMSSPIGTFLMTFFNARLGAWLGNPGRAGERTFHLGAPAQKVTPILAEMFGMTTDRAQYVALSDGGHFENLALYEMVLRRCRFILVSDAGCDPTAKFDDLGNAVRKIRVDLGVPIEFPDGVDIHSRDSMPTDGKGSYWAIGRIRYSSVDHSGPVPLTDGLLIYIKPALYGREPSDVKQYARVSATFPHESTADQFFSESQFESYRALGEFIVDELLTGLDEQTPMDVRPNAAHSLLAHWTRSRSGATIVASPPTEGSTWPTSAEKLTV